MKKIPHGSSHHGSGFSPSSPGYSFGDVHDSHPSPYAPSFPEFKPIGSSSHYQSQKPSYASFIKGAFLASSPPLVKPAHSSTPISHIYHWPSPSHSHHGPPSHPPMEYDYDPSLSPHSSGPKYPTPSGPGNNFGPSSGSGNTFGPSSSHEMHSISSDYGLPTGNAHLNSPPSTNYGYPIGNIEHQNLPPNLGQHDSQHSAQNVHQVVDAYNNQPANLPQVPQVPPAQIHITPTTNFIEYTNIQNADSQQIQHPQPQAAQGHPISQAQTATSQQMAEEVIKYLGNLQQQADGGAGNQKGNPQLFFGVNVPLGGNDGGGEAQDESFPLYPPGTNPQETADAQFFMPTPLPPDSAANSFAPSGSEFSGEQVPSYSHNANAQYPVDSYGNPVQVSKTLHKNHNHNNHNNHNHNGHVKFLKPQPSSNHIHHHHHPNGVSTQPRHKTKPEFDIVRSVSFELGAAGPVIHH